MKIGPVIEDDEALSEWIKKANIQVGEKWLFDKAEAKDANALELGIVARDRGKMCSVVAFEAMLRYMTPEGGQTHSPFDIMCMQLAVDHLQDFLKNYPIDSNLKALVVAADLAEKVDYTPEKFEEDKKKFKNASVQQSD